MHSLITAPLPPQQKAPTEILLSFTAFHFRLKQLLLGLKQLHFTQKGSVLGKMCSEITYPSESYNPRRALPYCKQGHNL